jgi:hypothetical protein
LLALLGHYSLQAVGMAPGTLKPDNSSNGRD